TSVRYRMNSSTHGVDLLGRAAVGRCRPWSTHLSDIERIHPRMAWIYWNARLVVGADRWSAHLSDIE
ncbi:hypothetical protein, partial [Stenotrophomonas sp.]|uniref:hypothetical protein n=1 Tax=Stenotrophomonas sp. TaxID=69392 RepID=UPI0028B0AD1E